MSSEADLAAQTTAEGQALAESLMADTCRMVKLEPVSTDLGTGETVIAETVKYQGKCRIRPDALIGQRQVESGSEIQQVLGVRVSIPSSVSDIEPDYVVIVDSSADPALVGRRLRIRQIHRGTHLTAHRLRCEEPR